MRVPGDPLIVDMDRDGKISTSSGMMYFDIDANGMIEQTKWAAGGDGLIVMDRDGDGKITSGRELFGDYTVMSDGRVAKSGFEALADLDSNKDGIIDARDEMFSQLRIWMDADGDGVFGDHELFTLDEVGIESIDLNYVNQRYTDENGNNVMRSSTVKWKDGDTSKVSEFIFVRDTYDTIEYNPLDVPDEIASLPDVPSSGFLYSLHQAMVRDESGALREIVERFAAEKDPLARRNILDEMLLAWSDISDAVQSSNTGKRKFMDRYYGELTNNFAAVLVSDRINLDRAYDMAKQHIYAQLLEQTHLSDAMGYLGVRFEGEGDDSRITFVLCDALEQIIKNSGGDLARAKNEIAELFMTLHYLDLSEYIDKEELYASREMLATYGADLFDACVVAFGVFERPLYDYTLPQFGTDGADAVYGGSINGGYTKDVLAGLSGNDTLDGGHGDDILIGGKGDDILRGGYENDIYIWNIGDGNDTIIDGSGANILQIGDGVHPSNARIERDGNSITLVIGESGERITIAPGGGSNTDPQSQRTMIEFADGTRWSSDYLLSTVLEYGGTDGADALMGSSGDDVISGGKGDDVLAAGYGSDTYVWNLGDGDDVITDARYYDDVNVLRFGDGIDPDKMVMMREGSSLVLIVSETGERVTLSGWYSQYNPDRSRLHRIEFADGTVWTPETIRLYGNGSIEGTDAGEIIDGLDGDDVITGRGGDDTLRGGLGNDTYVWNLGDGNDVISDSGVGQSNVLRFGEGISPSGVTVKRRGYAGYSDSCVMELVVEATGEVITIPDWNNNKLARVEFADGTAWSAEDVENIVGNRVAGTDGNDSLSGTSGPDVMIGGRGDDILAGSYGSDVYVWNLGDGNDTIRDSWQNGDVNVIRFGEGVSPDNIDGARHGTSSLILVVGESGERITLDGWFSSDNAKNIRFEFADGTVWAEEELARFTAHSIVGYDGDDVLNGYENNNIMIGGKGNDALQGAGGSDTYIWNLGDGNDVILDYRNTGDISVLKLGDGVRPEDLEFRRVGGYEQSDMQITVKPTGETITVSRWYWGSAYQLTRIEFANGDVLDTAEIESRLNLRYDGTPGDDRLIGSPMDDVLAGGPGNDTLEGSAGNDVYIWNLGDGNDVIYDYTGLNVIQLGEGVAQSDIKLVKHANSLVFAHRTSGETISISGWFTDPRYRMAEIRFADGGVWTSEDIASMAITEFWGDDRYGNTITGSSGDDVIKGGSAYSADYLYGMEGNDYIDGRAGNDVLDGGEGNDTLEGGTGDDSLTGGTGDDILRGGDGKDLLDGGDGDDVLGGGAGDDKLYGGSGNDALNGGDGKDTLDGGDGNDILEGGAGDDSLTGGTGDDVLRGGDGKDLLDGGDGDDVLDGGTGDDKLYGGSGNDALSGGDGKDTLDGGDGNDIIEGGTGDDALTGGEGDDVLRGGEGSDLLNGGLGSDVYLWNPGDGNDTINIERADGDIKSLRFGEGVSPDELYLRRDGNDMLITLTTTGEIITIKDWFIDDHTHRLNRVEFADGSAWADLSIGGNADLTLRGTYWTDELTGGDGDDVIMGAESADVLNGGLGNDTYIWNRYDGSDTIIDGGGYDALELGEGVYRHNLAFKREGDDVLIIVSDYERIRVKNWFLSPENAVEEIRLSDGFTLGRGEIESLCRSSFVGDDENNVIQGSYGNDEIQGLGGDDEIYGGESDDILSGGAGNDYLQGGDGDDVYIWNLGDGNDTVGDFDGNNALLLGDGISPADVRLTLAFGTDLICEIGPDNERITILNWDNSNCRTEIRFMDGTVWTKDAIAAMRPVIVGTDDCDYYLYGKDGNSDDILSGGLGDDYLRGGEGDDTYVWNLGDGHDVISDERGNNVLSFGEGINPDDVSLAKNGSSLVMTVADGDGSVTVENWILSDSGKGFTVRFSDGSAWTSSDIASRFTNAPGSDGEDIITGTDGDDVIDGGAGNDLLMGGAGDDTYVFRAGHGEDAISDGEGDTVIRMGEGVNPADVFLATFSGDGGVISDIVNVRTGDKISIDRPVDNLSEIHFADGTVWRREDFADHLASIGHYVTDNDSDRTVFVGLGGHDTLYVSRGGSATQYRLFGLSGDDSLRGAFGDDILVGGLGDDYMAGGGGFDTYVWERGDGNDTINDADGVGALQFGDGISPDGVITLKNGEHTIFIVGGKHRITVQSGLTEARFSDGTVWSWEDIRSKALPLTLRTNGSSPFSSDITGDESDELIIGGAKFDALSGRGGDDIYVWNAGDGNDVIYDRVGGNALVLGLDENPLLPSDFDFYRNSSDLFLALRRTGERITIKDWFVGDEVKRFGEIRFSDGATWGYEHVAGMDIPTLPATGGDDVLTGGSGDDTYVWNVGDGNDVIDDVGGKNILRFGPGVDADSVKVVSDGRDILFIIGGETVRVAGWIESYASGAAISEARFEDGTVWGSRRLSELARHIVGSDDADDYLQGTVMDEIIEGRGGDDFIYASGGSDVYLWNIGDGNDTIMHDYSYASVERALLLGDVTPDSVKLNSDGYDLLVSVGDETITVTGYFYTSMYEMCTSVNEIRFGDGTSWKRDDIRELCGYTAGTAGDDYLAGSEYDDTLAGGAGSDFMAGRGGNDKYIWNLGDGNDTISDSNGDNVLHFGDGITPEDVTAEISGRDMFFRVGATGEYITVNGWLNSCEQRRFEVVFADGSKWLWDEDTGAMTPIPPVVIEGTDWDDDYLYKEQYDARGMFIGDVRGTFIGGKGDDIIESSGGNNVFIWKPGDGNDTINHDDGSGVLRIGSGVRPEDVRVTNRVTPYGFSHITLLIGDESIDITCRYTLDFSVQFDDGAIWTSDMMRGMAEGIVVNGTDESDDVRDLAGDAADVITGGLGDDYLDGMGGDDVYIWRPGDGNDFIQDSRGNNVIAFGEGIEPGDITVARLDHDLQLIYKPTGEIITAAGWYDIYSEYSCRVSEIRFADGTVWSGEAVAELEPEAGVVNGTDGDDILHGGSYRPTVITGGKGDDYIWGGGAQDVYVWNIGDGNDVISDGYGGNALKLGEGVLPGDVRVAREGVNAVLFIGEAGGKITLRDYFTAEYNGFGEIRFSDGTVWNSGELFGGDIPTLDTDDGGVITGTNESDLLDGGDGKDTVIGNAGDDTITGNKGSDHLMGGQGDDLYVWNIGDGDDRVSDSLGHNAVLFGEGITGDSVKLSNSADGSLLVTIGEERVEITNWDDSGAGFELRFADGTAWTGEYINSIVTRVVGTNEADALHGTGRNDTIEGKAGADVVAGRGGDDVYLWNIGDGDDVISDGLGRNAVLLGQGITSETTSISRDNSNLYINIGSERLTLEKWFSTGNRATSVRFSDGVEWSADYLLKMSSLITGTEAGDNLAGYDTDDTIIGREGGDTLRGGAGNDTYLWNLGDGNDFIIDSQGGNALLFGEGITSEMVSIGRSDYDRNLYITVGEERITVQNWYYNGSATDRLREIRFSDGTVWNSVMINAMTLIISGTDGDDALSGVGGEGEFLRGLGGNDTIDGHGGDDVIEGGPGDDNLWGGSGDDLYIYNLGDGSDTISDYDYGDVLKFGEGISPDDVRLHRRGEDMRIEVGGETITVRNWSISKIHRLNMRFADGTVWDESYFDKLPNDITGTDEAEELFGSNYADDVINGGAAGDVLRGEWGDDVYVWNVGDGDDTIMDEQGGSSLALGEGVEPSSVYVARGGNYLRFFIGDETISVHCGNAEKDLTVRFADGTVWDQNKINELVVTVVGGSGADALTGSDAVNDIIVGRGGDDVMSGGRGDDTYIWNLGDGSDVISDTGGNDSIALGDGISPNDVTVSMSGANLAFAIGTESITALGWLRNEAGRIEELRFADGTVWNVEKILGEAGITYLGSDDGDRITGSAEDDLIIGSEGDDKIYGSTGDDAYIWMPGHGNDVIMDNSGSNSLILPGVNRGDISLARDNDSLLIAHKETGEIVTIESWFSGRSNKLSEIRLDDVTMTPEEIAPMFVEIDGSQGDDAIVGYDMGDVIRGHGGDDIISGLGGDDRIIGGAGDDRLYGGRGDDVYVWNVGDGSDTIEDGYGINTLELGGGLSSAAVSVTRDASDIYLHIGDEVIRVENWFKDAGNRLSEIRFSDGSSWNAGDVESRLGGDGVATPGNDVIHGSSGNDTLDGLAGNDAIYGLEGDDSMAGGTGNDKLYGGEGDDTYFWNIGNGRDVIEDGSGVNRLMFGNGINRDTLSFTAYGYDLLIGVGNTGDHIRVKGWFASPSNKLSSIELTDGITILSEEIDAGINLMHGTPGNDVLNGGGGVDLILGSDGNDRLNGGAGADSFVGGGGDDRLAGGQGDDSYIWNPGDGNDTIIIGGGRDVLHIGAGVNPSSMSVQRSGNDLVFLIVSGERITVQDWYQNLANRLSEVRFEDGTIWTRDYIDSLKSTYTGTGGNDTISGSAGDDLIKGGAGDDKMYGGAGKDTLIGESGDDYLSGGADDDIYIWNPGDGNDTISDNAGANVLRLGEGVNPKDVILTRSGASGKDLVIVMNGAGERITVPEWFTDSAHQLARVEFSDGTIWTRLKVTEAASAGMTGSEGDDVLYGSHIRDTLNGLGGNDKLFGYAENDTLVGGMGDDRLDGGAGDDTYIWSPGDGNDVIIDSAGSNTLRMNGVTASDVEISRNGNDMLLIVKTTGETVTVQKWHENERYQLSEVRFSDGSVLTRSDINQTPPVFKPEPEDEGGDDIVGSPGNDVILGSENDDILYGNGGNDTLSSGAGNDRLFGGAGDDTYLWNPGDGDDVIADKLGDNALVMGNGLDASDVEFELGGASGRDLIITISDTGETITVSDWGGSEKSQLSEIRFDDGSVLTGDDINAMLPDSDINHDPVMENGTSGDDEIFGGAGDDTLSGGAGNDSLSGGDGADIIKAGAGNDVITGGEGDDALQGEDGNDVYVWNLGDGNDTINDDSYNKRYRGDTGVLKIGGGASPDNVELTRVGNDAVFIIGESGERITVQNWYTAAYYQLTRIEFEDGTVWTAADVNAMSPVMRGTDGGGAINGTASGDVINGGDGADIIKAGAGNDVIAGGEGDDALQGDDGNDVYVWNLGDGNDTINDDSYNKRYRNDTGVLKMGGGASPENVELTRVGNDAVFIIGESGERITVQNWYTAAYYQLTRIEFEDGTVWTRDDANAIASGVVAPFSTAYASSENFSIMGIGDWMRDFSMSSADAGTSPSNIEFETARLQSEVAVAELCFGGQYSGIAGELMTGVSSYDESKTVTAARSESSLSGFFDGREDTSRGR
jgi:Ca2+-binding RTX toxin-like protein